MEIKKVKGRPKKNEEDKARGKDKLICDICYKTFSRHNAHQHRKTNYHITHLQIIEALKHSIKEFEGVKDFKDILKSPYVDNNNNVVYLSKYQYNFYSKLPNKPYKEIKNKNIDI